MALMKAMNDSGMPQPEVRITSRVIDSLYTEAMLLADEARSYFDDAGRDDRGLLEPFVRVSFAWNRSEFSLLVLTRVTFTRWMRAFCRIMFR